MNTAKEKKTEGKKLAIARAKVNKNSLYSIEDAVKFLKEASYVKFDETLEVAMRLGIDSKHSDQTVRGVVAMPFGTGKSVKIAVICKDDRIEEAKATGADMVGSTEIIEEIKAGTIKFDVCIATPDMMGVIGSVARILGPKGLMPNPKLGTVTADIQSAVKNIKSGQVEFRSEKGGIVHAGIGKLSFPIDNLAKNVDAFISAVVKAKPSGAKGSYLKTIYLSSTMGPSLQINCANYLS